MKCILLPPARPKKPYFDPLVEKKIVCNMGKTFILSMWVFPSFLPSIKLHTRKIIVYCATRKKKNYFCGCKVLCPSKARVRSTQVKLMFFSHRIQYFFCHGVKKCIFLLAGHKVDFIAPCGANKSTFWPYSRQKIVCNTGKTFILLVWLLPLLCSGIKLHTRKINFFFL